MLEARMSAVVDHRTGGVFRHDVVAISSSVDHSSAANQRAHQTAQPVIVPLLQTDTDGWIDRINVTPRRKVSCILRYKWIIIIIILI